MYKDSFYNEWLKYIQQHNAEAVANYVRLRWEKTGGFNESYEVALNTGVNELNDGSEVCIKSLVDNILKDKYGYQVICYDPLVLSPYEED